MLGVCGSNLIIAATRQGCAFICTIPNPCGPKPSICIELAPLIIRILTYQSRCVRRRLTRTCSTSYTLPHTPSCPTLPVASSAYVWRGTYRFRGLVGCIVGSRTRVAYTLDASRRVMASSGAYYSLRLRL